MPHRAEKALKIIKHRIFKASLIGALVFAAIYLLLAQTQPSLPTTANIAEILSNIQPSQQQNQQPNQQTQTTTTSQQTQQQQTQQTTTTSTTTQTSATATTTTTATEEVGGVTCKGTKLCTYDTVVEVIDGDTLRTERYGKIRLALVNAPEKDEEGYDDAKEFLTDICLNINPNVYIDQDDLQPDDGFGRIVAKVFCDELNMNEELYYGGYAKIMTEFCEQSEFATEEWAIDGGC